MANITLTNQTNSPVQIDTTHFGVNAPASAELVGTDLQIAEVYRDAGLGVLNPGLLPVNSVAPAITGTLTVGEVLTTTNGTWSNSPTYARQWQVSDDGTSGWSDVAGATNLTYVLVGGDATMFFRSRVTATTTAGSIVAYSNVVGPVA